MTGQTTVFTIPAGIAFADALARGLNDQAGGDPLALAATTILLPTRRAARAITDAFLRVADGKALLLPRLVALADLDGDQDMLGAGELPPALDPLSRHLILARLVLSRGDGFKTAPDQALRLAEALADLIDEAETEKVDFAGLAELAPEAFAQHWQQTVAFLRIVTAYWPAILDERGMVDPARRRVLALEARAAQWLARSPADPIVAAGFIAADPALAALIKIVAGLPQGQVVLPGLDQGLDDEAWDAVAETHPQFGLKELVARIGIARRDVVPWPGAAAPSPRVRLLSEALRPAETTEQWRSGAPITADAVAGLLRIDCATAQEEAEVIALALRETLETPGRTAALVTPDRGLARRVAAALRRWRIDVDDSAGQPLSETPVGVWLRLVADCVVGGFAPRPLLAMLKHPLAAGGQAPEELRARVRLIERKVLRGPRPGAGLAGLRTALAQVADRAFDGGGAEKAMLAAWLDDLAERLAPFTALVSAGTAPLDALLRLHAEASEALADTPLEPGPVRLWRGQDGEAAAQLISRLGDPDAHGLPPIPVDRYPAVLGALMQGISVRPLYGAHPRLAIWGLIEARLQRADLMILGGLNEGTWPPLPGDEPWMSAEMRRQFGLPALETRIGQAAQDFALAAAAPRVLLTRAARVEGAPSVEARFLSRLKAVLAGSKLVLPTAPAQSWRAWAEALDRPDSIAPCAAPQPAPPLHARPRELPVTAIETWMRDPYALYARRILNLAALDPLDADPGAAERGQFIHDALDRFIAAHLTDFPDDTAALAALLKEGRRAFGEALGHPSVAAFWWPRFERVARWFIAFERERRRDGTRPVATELRGQTDFAVGPRSFRLIAKADRIDRLPGGALAIIDYKTGRPPPVTQVVDGTAPQLPLEAVIAARGDFRGLPALPVTALIFMRLSGGNPPGLLADATGRDYNLDDVVEAAEAGIVRLVAAFDDPSRPYLSKPRPEVAYAGDYDHLARVGEWPIA
jgi:ATP-dependent helicase/nuclease subunit B